MIRAATTAANRVISQYLKNYAEPEARSLDALSTTTPYCHCLVIPAYNEDVTSLVDFIRPALTAHDNCIVIIVLNRPDTDSDLAGSETAYNLLTKNSIITFKNKNIETLYNLSLDSELLIVDRFRERPIPAKQGVGLARKIGCDIALALHNKGLLDSPWIHTTDCDTRLPESYFQATDALVGEPISAAIYPFYHSALSDDARAQLSATQDYEAALRYYVDRLRYAGSPYAYHTIGSCMAVTVEDYAKVRGFPKRAAGEDFYLLNKLAKLRPVRSLAKPILTINSRESERTPFGTGRAVSQIMSLEEDEPYCYYNSQSFDDLKQLLSHFNRLTGHHNDYQTWLNLLPETTQKALLSLSINSLFEHLTHHIKPSDSISHAHRWFDGFKTLKFIRLLKTAYPDTPIDSRYYAQIGIE